MGIRIGYPGHLHFQAFPRDNSVPSVPRDNRAQRPSTGCAFPGPVEDQLGSYSSTRLGHRLRVGPVVFVAPYLVYISALPKDSIFRASESPVHDDYEVPSTRRVVGLNPEALVHSRSAKAPHAHQMVLAFLILSNKSRVPKPIHHCHLNCPGLCDTDQSRQLAEALAQEPTGLVVYRYSCGTISITDLMTRCIITELIQRLRASAGPARDMVLSMKFFSWMKLWLIWSSE